VQQVARRVAVTPISSDGLSCSSPPSWAVELLSLFEAAGVMGGLR
jgi:hypothetical protein